MSLARRFVTSAAKVTIEGLARSGPLPLTRFSTPIIFRRDRSSSSTRASLIRPSISSHRLAPAGRGQAAGTAFARLVSDRFRALLGDYMRLDVLAKIFPVRHFADATLASFLAFPHRSVWRPADLAILAAWGISAS